MRGLSLVFEVFVKICIALAVGLGVGMLTFGITLLAQGGLSTFDDLERSGPPPADTFLAGGVGLLTMAIMLLILSVGPLARRRWFLSPREESEYKRPREAPPDFES
jgi:hypothetical protein